jgi:hypothetical protein
MDYVVFNGIPDVTSLKGTKACPGFDRDWVVCDQPGLVRVYGIVIDRRILEGNAASLSQFHSNDSLVHAQGSHQFPLETVRLVYNVLKAVDQEQRARPPPLVKKQKKGKNGGEGGEEDDNEGLMSALFNTTAFKNIKPRSTQTFQESDQTLNRVEVFLEDIYDETDTRIIGWRLHLFKNDPKFDINAEIERQALVYSLELERENRNKRRLVTAVNTTESLSELSVRNKEDWVSGVLDQYQMPLTGRSLQGEPEVVHYPLWEYENPACFERIASFELSCDLIRIILPDAHPRYMDHTAYVTGQGEFLDFRFPRPVRWLNRLDRRPGVFHHALLFEDELSRRNIQMLSEMHRRHQIMAKQTDALIKNNLHSTDVVDVVKLKAKLNATAFREARSTAKDVHARMVKNMKLGLVETIPSFETVLRAELERLRRSQPFIERLVGLMCNSRNHTPGKAAVFKWLHDQMNDSIIRDEKKFSIMTVFPEKSDPAMSPLANMMAQEALWADTVHGIMTLHREFIILDISRLTWYDSRKNPLFPHMALDGAAGIGKSELMELTRDKCIPGSYRMVGHDSAKAYANGKTYDHQAFFYDETPLNFSNHGDNGTGDPILKSMLSRNEVITTTTSFDANGKRFTEEIYTSMKITIIMNSNDYSIMPDTMKSRLNPVFISKYLNMGADMSVKNAQVDPDVLEGVKFIKMKEQALVCMVETAIEAGFLPQVNMDSVILQWSRMKRFFASNASIYLDNRRDKFVISYVRGLCLKEAVHRVFCTEEVFSYAKPFEYTDLLSIAPYLTATEEQLVFIVTLLEDSLTDSLMGEVLDAMWNRCHSEVNGVMRPTFSVDAGATCYQTLFLKVSGTQPTDEKVISKAAAMLTKDIQSVKERELYKRSVQTILIWMTGQMVRAESYTGETEEVDETKMTSLPMVTVRSLNSVDSGLEINRALLARYKARSAGTMDMAIEDCLHKHTVKRVLLTGRTFRERGPDMVPCLFKTIELSPNPSKPNVMENINYRSTEYCKSVSSLLAVPFYVEDRKNKKKEKKATKHLLGDDDEESETSEEEEEENKENISSLLIRPPAIKSTADKKRVGFDRSLAKKLNEQFTQTRFVRLEKDLDSHFYQKFLDDNGLKRNPVSSFPVETSWQERVRSYPTAQKKEYEDSFTEYKPWAQTKHSRRGTAPPPPPEEEPPRQTIIQSVGGGNVPQNSVTSTSDPFENSGDDDETVLGLVTYKSF